MLRPRYRSRQVLASLLGAVIGFVVLGSSLAAVVSVLCVQLLGR